MKTAAGEGGGEVPLIKDAEQKIWYRLEDVSRVCKI